MKLFLKTLTFSEYFICYFLILSMHAYLFLFIIFSCLTLHPVLSIRDRERVKNWLISSVIFLNIGQQIKYLLLGRGGN